MQVPGHLGIENLPVELLYEVQLIALSPGFPHTSKRLYQVFKTAPTSYNAQYIMRKVSQKRAVTSSGILTRALRFPLCNENIVRVLYQRPMPGESQVVYCELPKRLFRNLNPTSSGQSWRGSDEPLPFLQYLYNIPGLRPDANSHKGYALTRAVHAGHEPLIKFLLEQGALPGPICVKIAIQRKNLALVRMLMESKEVVGSKDMLKLAMKCDAWDIAEYLTQEKGVIPDLQTLLAMGSESDVSQYRM